MAIPLSLVVRLEEFPSAAIELSGEYQVIQYRGEIMPLLHLSRIIPGLSHETPVVPSDRLLVVVYSERGRSAGLIVDRIIDIVDQKPVMQSPTPRSGVLGSSIVQQRVTDLLDIPRILHEVFPGFAERHTSA